MRLRPTSGELMLAIGLIAAVVAGPVLLRGHPAEQARLQTNSRRIEEMTEAERSRLDRNFTQWQAMTSAQQDEWRRFVSRLDDDRTINHGRLSRTMEAYYAWLQTVPGYRREELRNQSSPQERTDLVMEIVADQLARRIDSPPVDIPRYGRVVSIPTLSSEELSSVMASLEEALLPEERNRLVGRNDQPLEGLDRYLKVMSLLIERYRGRPVEMLMSAQVRGLVYKSVPESIRTELSNEIDFTRPELAYRLLEMLRQSLRLEAERRRADLRITPERLQQFFTEKVSQDEQEQLLNLTAEELQAELIARYYRTEMEGRVALNVEQLQQFLRPEESRRWREGPLPGDRGYGEGGPQPLLPGRFNRPRGDDFLREGDPRRTEGRSPPPRGDGEGRDDRPRPPPPGGAAPPRGDRPPDRPPEGMRPRDGDRPPRPPAETF